MFGKNAEEFLFNLEAVLLKLDAVKMRLNEEKCVFLTNELSYLGHQISAEGIKLSDDRKMAIAALKSPKNVSELRSVLGIMNYFRAYIPKYALLTKPLTSLLSKFVWTEQTEEHFQILKRAVMEAGLLAYLDYTKPIYVRCDASMEGIGAVLFQKEGEIIHPVAFLSQAFNETQRRYSTLEQEGHFLEGHFFILETDHQNLLKILSDSKQPKIFRWRVFLSSFDFELKHIKGTENEVADALSRLGMKGLSEEKLHVSDVCDSKSSMIEDFNVTEEIFTEDEGKSLVELELKRDCVTDLEANAKSGVDGQLTMMTRSKKFNGAKLVSEVKNDVTMVKKEVVVPREKLEIIKKFHNFFQGHLGVKKTYNKIRRNGHDKITVEDVSHFIGKCHVCQKFNVKPYYKQVLSTIQVSDSPSVFYSIDVDTIGPLMEKSGYEYILAISDTVRRYTILKPIRTTRATDAANGIVEIAAITGTPSIIRSDNGSKV